MTARIWQGWLLSVRVGVYLPIIPIGLYGLATPAIAQSTFTTSCYGNVTVWFPPCGSTIWENLGETASITFPTAVPLDGTMFSGPAILTVNIEGFSQTLTLPGTWRFSYGPSAFSYIDFNTLHIFPPSNGVTTVVLEETPPDNSAYFTLGGGGDPTGAEIAYFVLTGTYAALAAPYSPGEVANGVGVVFTQLTSSEPSLQVTTTSLPNATGGQPYSSTLAATGGSGTGYVWSILSGSPPVGFSLSPGGVLGSAGIPAATPQTYTFAVQVTDSAGNTATQALTLVVQPSGLQITTTKLPNATSGQSYGASLTASGGTGSGYVWSVTSGALPAGFALSSGGTITSSGTPTAAVQSYVFTVQVTDSAGDSATQTLTLVVGATSSPTPTPIPTPTPTPTPTPSPSSTTEPDDPYPISLGDPSSQPGSCSCGDPINLSTGNLFEKVTDYETAGPNKLAFTRYYNSLIGKSTFAVSLGNNWRSTFDRYLNVLSTLSVTAERQDGQVLSFSTDSSGALAAAGPFDYKLTQSGTNWVLTDPDDTTETYIIPASGGEALLTSIRWRNGYTQTLRYNPSNQLTSVTDSYNRTLTFVYQGALLQSLTTPDGIVVAYVYDAGSVPTELDRLVKVQYPTVPVFYSYIYGDSTFPYALTGIVDEDHNRYATWTYDSSGRALTSQHGTGADLTTIAYDDTTGNRTVTNSLGQQTTYKFIVSQGAPKILEIDRLATATTAAATETFTYDANGYVGSITNWNGNKTTYVNDVHGQPTTIDEAVGTPQARTTTISYLSNYHLPMQIVTPGLTTNLSYDGSGDLLTKTQVDTTSSSAPSATDGQIRTWTYTWSNFLLASVLGPRTDVSQLTQFTYDGSGTLTAATNAFGQVTKITQHLPGGLPQTVVDLNGVTTTLTYDGRLRLLTRTTATAAGPLTTQYTYDPAGNLLSVTLPDGSAVTNSYDAAHRLIGTADLFKNGVAYTLDAAGDRTGIAISNSGGTIKRQHSATFDALGRLLRDTGGVGQTTGFGYDADGNAVTVTDPLQRLTQRAFDALNRLTQITDPAQGVTEINYDPHNRPISVEDPNGNVTTYTYDGFGDVIQEVSPARGTTIYHYDLAGNLAQKTDARGTLTNYTYDALNRVTAAAYPGDAIENVSYIYDQAAGGFGIGRLTSVSDAVGTLSQTYDERGNVLTESRAHGSGASAVTLLTKYAYDDASRIISITYPSGTAVAYARDGMGRIASITAQPRGAAQPTQVLSKISYEPFGPPSALTYGNGVTESRNFDLDYRLTALSGAGNQQVQSLSYGYNAANDVLSITDGVAPGNSQTFGYDALDRLTSATGGYGSLAYTYDANGNRLTETPAAPVTLDGLGSITGFAYNQAGRLASTTAGTQQLTQYTYDAFGQRFAKVGNVTGTTLFQYDEGGRLLEETNSQGSAEADYIYLDGHPVAEFSAGKLYFLHDDRLGTPQTATDPSQATVWVGNYQPFGALNTATSQTALLGQDLRFPGQENDLETGLYHNGFRDYVPGLGRYGQSDPIGLMGGINAYRYASSNPLKWTDERGLSDGWSELQPVTIGCTASGINPPLSSSQPSQPISVSFGFGGNINWGPFTFESDSGVAFDSSGNICLYGNVCTDAGHGAGLGGFLGLVGQVSTGALNTGSQTSQGYYYYGGTGVAGEGQLIQGADGAMSYGRGLFGVGAGAGAGRIQCTTQYLCLGGQ